MRRGRAPPVQHCMARAAAAAAPCLARLQPPRQAGRACSRAREGTGLCKQKRGLAHLDEAVLERACARAEPAEAERRARSVRLPVAGSQANT